MAKRSFTIHQRLQEIWEEQQRIFDLLTILITDILSIFNETHCLHCEIVKSEIATGHKEVFQSFPYDFRLASWAIRLERTDILRISLLTNDGGVPIYLFLEGQTWTRTTKPLSSLSPQTSTQKFEKDIRAELEELLEEFAKTLSI